MAKIEPIVKPCRNCGATNLLPVPAVCRLCGAELWTKKEKDKR